MNIMKIKENINKNFVFFSIATRDEVGKETKQLDKSKSQPFNNISQKLLKIIETFSQTLLLSVLIHEYRPHGFLPP